MPVIICFINSLNRIKFGKVFLFWNVKSEEHTLKSSFELRAVEFEYQRWIFSFFNTPIENRTKITIHSCICLPSSYWNYWAIFKLVWINGFNSCREKWTVYNDFAKMPIYRIRFFAFYVCIFKSAHWREVEAKKALFM